MNIHIIGNCQVRPIATYLRHTIGNGDHILTVWPKLHLIQEAECSQLIDSLHSADVLVCMPVGDNYRSMPLGSSQIAERCPPHCKVIIYPNSYFKGYHPTFDYARDQDGNHILSSNPLIEGVNPFTDYHDAAAAIVCLTHQGGDDMIFDKYIERLSLTTDTLKNIVSKSLAEIERRDASCSFSLHPIIKTQYQKYKLFHSFNHPTNALMKIVASKILEEAGLAAEDCSFSSVSNDSEFLGHPNLPIMPCIHDALILEFPRLELDQMKQQYFQYFSFIRMNRLLFSSVFLQGDS